MTFDIEQIIFGGPPEDEVPRQQAVRKSGAVRLRGNEALARISAMAAQSYDVPMSAISIIDRDRQIFLARQGLTAWETSRGESFCAVAIHRPGEALIVPDARIDRRFANHPGVRLAPFLRFYAGVPILDKGGYPLGALCIADTKAHGAKLDATELMMLAREAERIMVR